MSAPRDYISSCVYCGHSFHVGDNAQCVLRWSNASNEPSEFVHLGCLGSWTRLQTQTTLQARARIRVVG
jgi:hypothetical protein